MEIQKYRQMSNSHRMDNRNTRKCLRNLLQTKYEWDWIIIITINNNI
jgi:hypothetical protein